MRRIKHISLHNFRSYEAAALPCSGKSVILTGENGAGKTNLLEALSMLSAGRGMRHAKLADLPYAPRAELGWAVTAKLSDDDDLDEVQLGTGVTPNIAGTDKRSTRINGAAKSSSNAMMDYVRFLWLTPAQDRLFMDGAAERRKFIDRMTLAHAPEHAHMAKQYELAMRQRNKILDNAARHQKPIDEALLNIIESQMAEAGVALAAARCDMIAKLSQLADRGYGLDDKSDQSGDDIADLKKHIFDYFPKSNIHLEGILEDQIAAGHHAADIEDQYTLHLHDMRRRDMAAGRTIDGPHRSELHVTHQAKNQAARLCSTGEQKALLTGLVLANAAALGAQQHLFTHEYVPLVLLLDEIAAHLDEFRRGALFDLLDAMQIQVFMTGTDKSLFQHWGNRADHFIVKDGAAHLVR